jgi:hypothetical protein
VPCCGLANSGFGGGDGAPRPWAESYNASFLDLPNQDLIAGGVVTINGIDWTVQNVANATALEVVNGTGLRMAHVDVIATQKYNGVRDCPIMSAPLTAFLPEYNSALYNVRISVGIPTMTVNFWAPTGGAKVGLEQISAPTQFDSWVNRTRNMGNLTSGLGITNGGTTRPNNTAQTDTARQLVWSQEVMRVRSAPTYGDPWVERWIAYPTQPLWPGGVGTTTTKTMILNDPTDVRLFLSVDTDGAGGGGIAFESVFTDLVVEFQER